MTDKTTETKKYLLKRTGNVPLSFEGELLSSQEGPWHRGREHRRFFDLRVYRTMGGKYIAERNFRTSWTGESESHSVEVFSDLDKVGDFFRLWRPDYQSLPHVGYPSGKQFQEKQARLFAGLTKSYEERLTALLEPFNLVEIVS